MQSGAKWLAGTRYQYRVCTTCLIVIHSYNTAGPYAFYPADAYVVLTDSVASAGAVVMALPD